MIINIEKLIEGIESKYEVFEEDKEGSSMFLYGKTLHETEKYALPHLTELSNRADKKVKDLANMGVLARDSILVPKIGPFNMGLIKLHELLPSNRFYAIACGILNGSYFGGGFTLKFIERTDVKELSGLLRDYMNEQIEPAFRKLIEGKEG